MAAAEAVHPGAAAGSLVFWTPLSCVVPAVLAFWAGQTLAVTELRAHDNRDLALLYLERPATGVTPIALATSVAMGEPLKAVGYGRTKDEWVPVSRAQTSVSVEDKGITASSLNGDVSGAICRGDAGGPVINGKGELVGVTSTSSLHNCIGEPAGKNQAVITRTDNVTDWVKDANAHTFAFTGKASGKALDAKSDGSVIIWDHWGGDNQKFTHTRAKELRVFGSNCLAPAGDTSKLPAPMHAVACTGESNQKWNLDNADNTIRHQTTGLCLEVKGWGTDNGSPATLYTCTGGANQKWTKP
ncbi:ricin-type beta-trefoil lectin domain protein [Kitasatospora sp. NPDC057936]|uniref:ricin-type beta-trefoil lectin domain protein n=1 Tax=Kitasatospora sp. NPDC057936 TaxID=3346283 RepID=UPI0036D8602C